MASIIPFEGNALPAYLQGNAVVNDLTVHASAGGFPVISIKGKTFSVVRDGERKIVPNPKDPESPASAIDMVIIKANKHLSKVFYMSGYVEGAENVKPDCFSNDGVKPDPQSTHPQATSCAACPQNIWGSKITEAGKKAKACQDSVRIAVAAPGALNDPYMIRVPPATIRALGEYGKMLEKKGVSPAAVITRIAFEPTVATPQLTFKPLGFVTEEQYKQVMEMRESDVVQNILGAGFVDAGVPEEAVAPQPVVVQPPVVAAPAAPALVQEEVAGVVPPIATKAKVVTESEVIAAVEAKPKAAAQPAPVVTGQLVGGVDLGALTFDD